MVARRARVAAAVVSYSLPWLTKVAGAAVEFDLVEFFATGLALAAVFAFFGGMLAVYHADVRAVVECLRFCRVVAMDLP